MKYTRIMILYTIVEAAVMAINYKMLNSYSEANAKVAQTTMSVFTIMGVALAGIFVVLLVRKMMEQRAFITCFILAVVCMLMPLGVMLYLLRNLS